jgi:hypothetical protein
MVKRVEEGEVVGSFMHGVSFGERKETKQWEQKEII